MRWVVFAIAVESCHFFRHVDVRLDVFEFEIVEEVEGLWLVAVKILNDFHVLQVFVPSQPFVQDCIVDILDDACCVLLAFLALIHDLLTNFLL